MVPLAPLLHEFFFLLTSSQAKKMALALLHLVENHHCYHLWDFQPQTHGYFHYQNDLQIHLHCLLPAKENTTSNQQIDDEENIIALQIAHLFIIFSIIVVIVVVIVVIVIIST